MKLERKSRVRGGLAALASMTMLAILTYAVWNTLPLLFELRTGDETSHPEFRLTGFRYYLRRHNRLNLVITSVDLTASLAGEATFSIRREYMRLLPGVK